MVQHVRTSNTLVEPAQVDHCQTYLTAPNKRMLGCCTLPGRASGCLSVAQLVQPCEGGP